MKKPAETRFPVLEVIAERWSPRAFQSRAVEQEKLGSVLEAARWAPSAFNEQPWSFLVASREDAEAYERLADCLVEGNAWAKSAPVLMLSVAATVFVRNGKRNRHAEHDVGLAVGGMILQAEALGLATHQMAGFDAAKARTTLGLPDEVEPMAMIAMGYPGEPDDLPEALAERERAPRVRKALDEFVFGAGWKTAPRGLE